jgi:nitroreductase
LSTLNFIFGVRKCGNGLETALGLGYNVNILYTYYSNRRIYAMSVNKLISSRRSIRKYRVGEPVTAERLHTLLEAAMLAPSACNMRPWKFIAVRNRVVLDKISAIHPFAGMLKTADAAILVLADLNIRNDISAGFFPQDCGAATENILLQAAELGLGTCWCGVYPKDDKVAAFRKLFELPENLVPINVIAVGVPDEEDGSRGFYEEEKVSWID